MNIALYTSDTPKERVAAESWARALICRKHPTTIYWHPVDMPEKAEFDLGFEIGCRCAGCNIGVPFIHYVPDPVGDIPGEWIRANLVGHLFFFGDFDSHVKAHKSGIRTAEYLPAAWDSLAPFPESPPAIDYEIGYFGDWCKEAEQILLDAKKFNLNWRVGIWGNRHEWKKSSFGSWWVDELPNTNELRNQMDRCRYVASDPRHNRPDYMFMQAAGSRAVAVAPFSGDLWECFELSRFLYARGNEVEFFNSIDNDTAWSDAKEHQLRVIGFADGPCPRNEIEMKPCAAKLNRYIDRVDYLFSILEMRNLYDNAKATVKQQTMVKMEMEGDEAFIRIGYPHVSNMDQIQLDYSSKSIKPAEIPLLLRRAARVIEELQVSGKLQANTIHVPAQTV